MCLLKSLLKINFLPCKFSSEKSLLTGKCTNEVDMSRYGVKVTLLLAMGGNISMLSSTNTDQCKLGLLQGAVVVRVPRLVHHDKESWTRLALYCFCNCSWLGAKNYRLILHLYALKLQISRRSFSPIDLYFETSESMPDDDNIELRKESNSHLSSSSSSSSPSSSLSSS